MFLEVVKGTLDPGSLVEQEELPWFHEFLVLFGVWWRQNVGLVFTPHLSSHHTGVVGTVADGNARGIIDQMRYLLSVMLVGRGEIDGGQLPTRVDGSV